MNFGEFLLFNAISDLLDDSARHQRIYRNVPSVGHKYLDPKERELRDKEQKRFMRKFWIFVLISPFVIAAIILLVLNL